MSQDGDSFGNHGMSDILVLGLSSNGDVQWRGVYGGGANEGGYAVECGSEDGIEVVGYSASTDGDAEGPVMGNTDIWVLSLSLDGELVHQRKYGSMMSDFGRGISADEGVGFNLLGVVAGDGGDVTASHGTDDFWLAKLDHVGNVAWQKSYGGSSFDVPQDFDRTSDSGFVLAGYTSSNDGDVSGYHGGFSDGWIVKVDSSGNVEWQRALGGGSTDWIQAVAATNDGGCLVAGFTESNDGDVSGNHGGADGWVVKLDAGGNVEWQRTLGGTGNDQFNSVVLTTDGGFALAGFTNSTNGDVSYSLGGGDGWVVKLDSLGNLQWDLPLGGSGSDFLRKIRQTEDGGFLVAGDSNSNDGHATGNHGGKDIWVVKLGPDPSAISEGPPAFPFAVFPNPGRDLVRLQYAAHTSGTAQLEVFNGAGQLALAPMRRTVHPGPQSWEFDASPLAPGTYQLRLSTADGVVCPRLVKLP